MPTHVACTLAEDVAIARALDPASIPTVAREIATPVLEDGRQVAAPMLLVNEDAPRGGTIREEAAASSAPLDGRAAEGFQKLPSTLRVKPL